VATTTYDYIIIGAGIVGLATALKLLKAEPTARIALVDKENAVAKHQTGHNSGVIHSGVYYKPGSLKAELCTSGASQLTQLCKEQGVPFNRCGKIIVATSESEVPALDELQRRAIANGVAGLQRLDSAALHQKEPEVKGVSALFISSTAIVDFKVVAATYLRLIHEQGAQVFLGSPVTQISDDGDSVTVTVGSQRLQGRFLIACAGLYSDRIARLAGFDNIPQILPFRGEYYNLSPDWSTKVKHLVYPVPDPRFPFLGVHLTLKMDGTVEAGPNAVLATSREGYAKTDISAYDCWQYLRYSGFWKMVGKYWKTGLAEAYRSISKRAFCRDLQKLFPGVHENDLQPGGSGVRAQLVMQDGKLHDDFVIASNKRMVHVLNAPSPAATASLAIGDYITKLARS
jgi:L-2-hydroxyglutarate oxidase